MTKPAFKVVAINDEPQSYRPRLDWVVSRRDEVNAISRCDVAGHEAFARAGLVAWASPSDHVRLFVFMPSGRPLSDGMPWGNTAWRYEAWLVARQEHIRPPMRLVRPIAAHRECITPDLVEVFAAAELTAQTELYAYLGKLR